jgi:hypothetical protein
MKPILYFFVIPSASSGQALSPERSEGTEASPLFDEKRFFAFGSE